jgi:SAM-dependent methyltransferase
MILDPYYKSRYTWDKDRILVWKEIVRYLKKFISSDSTVVDLGAGYCDFINNIDAKEKYAIDSSPELKNFVGSKIRSLVTFCWDLSYIKDSSIDIIHASNLLEHLSDEELQKTINEIKRILKSEGMLIVMQPNYKYSAKKYFDDPTHKKIFTDEILQDFLISNGFNIIQKKVKFLPLSIKSRPHFIPIFPLLVRAYIYSPWKPFAGQMLFIAKKND